MSQASLNPGTLPPEPTRNWSDDTLKRKWGDYWEAHHTFEMNGALRHLALHHLHDELVKRGIDPAAVLRKRGFNVDSIELPEKL